MLAVPTIQIKDVPPEVHRTLRQRAAAAGQSLQEYMLALVKLTAAHPTLDEVLKRAAARSRGTQLDREEIVAALRADREEH